MAQTVIGVFESESQARQAMRQLLEDGFTHHDIDISAQGTVENETYEREDRGDSISNFFSSLFDSHDEVRNHSDAARRGSVVTVHADSTQEAERAADILDEYGALDVNEQASTYSQSSNTNVDANADTTADASTSIPVIEEQMEVGKRVVETGGVRLRSRIIERPVEENLRLRVEHVHVERNPVNRAATEADLENFKEGTIEATEHAEVPVVGKEARVVEEVRLSKDVEERNETVRGTVRNTDVDVEHIEAEEDVDRDRRRDL